MSENNALYKKYRPQKISAFVGNMDVKKSLIRMFKRDLDKIPRVFLFTGIWMRENFNGSGVEK